jgi:hypothetical protein
LEGDKIFFKIKFLENTGFYEVNHSLCVAKKFNFAFETIQVNEATIRWYWWSSATDACRRVILLVAIHC